MSAEYGLEEILDDMLPMFSELQLIFFPLFKSTALSQSEEIYECRRGTRVSGSAVSSKQIRKVHRDRVEISCCKPADALQSIAEQNFGRPYLM